MRSAGWCWRRDAEFREKRGQSRVSGRSLFPQFWVYRAERIKEFFDVAQSCVIWTLPADVRVAMVTVSGGVGVLMADDANGRGLAVPEMPEEAQRRMLELVTFAAARNPIDVTGRFLNDPSLLDQAIELAATNGDYGSLISFQGSSGRNPALMEATRASWIERERANPDKHFAVSRFCTADDTWDLEAVGIPVYEEATHATCAAAALAGFARSFRERRPRPAVPAPASLPTRPVNELAALNVVATAGVPTVPARNARTAREATDAAADLGFPNVLKVLSADILHKGDIEGVRLGVADRAAAETAFDEILAAARTDQPDATIDGYLVAPMVTGGVETILGVQRDPVFGPIVMFGLGGIFVEALKGVTFRAAPFDEAEARAMIESVASYPLPTGLRRPPSADLDALAAASSRFAAANADGIESLDDINPVLVRPEGTLRLLRASHIVPWAECETDAERLNVHNGLLLTAHLDAAFDANLIAFDTEGTILFSPQLPEVDITAAGFRRGMRLRTMHPETERRME